MDIDTAALDLLHRHYAPGNDLKPLGLIDTDGPREPRKDLLSLLGIVYALQEDVRRLRSDLNHARQWATWSARGMCSPQGTARQLDDNAVTEARMYCVAVMNSESLWQRVEASDGWHVGKRTQSLEDRTEQEE